MRSGEDKELNKKLENQWALVLGASSGFGAAAAKELARAGMHIFGVHMDRRGTMVNVENLRDEIQSSGKESMFFNMNAADSLKRGEALDQIERKLKTSEDGTRIQVFLHSLAFGSLRRYFPDNLEKPITQDQVNMTLEVMAHSLVYWVQELVSRQLVGEGSRIFAMTSSGGHKVWHSYGSVSAAKAALESHIRQIALELAPKGITANAIQAGVTDTPALRKIPGYKAMIENSLRSNPGGRLTTPEDVARAIVVFSHPHTAWMTGNVIRVDGGEDITA